MNTHVKLELALENIHTAIEYLAEIGGMDGIVAELEVQAGVIESEIVDLEPEDYDDSDPGELVEWHDFDPDC